MIQISQLKKQYKEAVVLDIPELLISKGECFGLVGNNGAGKTNFMEAISFLSPGRGLRRAVLPDIPRLGASNSFTVFAAIDGIRSQTWDLLGVGEELLVANNEGVYAVRGEQARLRQGEGIGHAGNPAGNSGGIA